MKTPKTRRSQGDAVNLEKSSGKKLVQARLPFKILTPTEGVTLEKKSTEKETSKETKKRRLSYEQEEVQNNEIQPETKRKSLRKSVTKNVVENKTKQGRKSTTTTENVVILSDDSVDNRTDSKENSLLKEKQGTIENNTDNEIDDDVELIASSSDDDKEKIQKSAEELSKSKKKSTKKQAPAATNQNKQQESKTPQSAGKKTPKGGRKSVNNETTDAKVQIKLPMSSKKNKRRKSAPKVTKELDATSGDLSDDVELISAVMHPQKRPKLEETKRLGIQKSAEKPIDSKEKEKDGEVNQEDVEIDVCKENKKMKDFKKGDKKVEPLKEDKKKEQKNEQAGLNIKTVEPEKDSGETVEKDKISKIDLNQSKTSEIDLNLSKPFDQSISTSDVEADAETEATVNSNKREKMKKNRRPIENLKNEVANSPKSEQEMQDSKTKKGGNLTPKQQSLHDRRMKAREEKERKIQEERLQKQKEKEERELAKKRERDEKEEQRRKEKEEREEQRRKEREEKEAKRLAEIEAKNEEKRKRNEAKEEEQRKREEERKRKEQEREEAEIKKKKAALAFTKFFSRPTQDGSNNNPKECSDDKENDKSLAFRPFQIKGDMKLAPTVRKELTIDDRTRLESVIELSENETKKKGKSSPDLYLKHLKYGLIKPCKWCPPTPTEVAETKEANDDDVVIVEDELERAGQAIVEEPNGPIEKFRVKFFKFHENRRPPYYGTWRKRSHTVTPRRPFAQDKKFFDYEVDSDDEWEEEEPGESLDGSEDDKEKESEDEDYEVDNEWFVPHGHLSDEELQNEDDLGDNNDREAQKAKLQILQQEFAQEMKKKTQKIKPRLIGCIWVDENGNQPEDCPKIIWDTLNMRSILCAEPPIIEEIEVVADKNGDSNSNNVQSNDKTNGETKLRPITLTEPMLKQLVLLLHGNTNSKNFLINEFIAYIEANEESVQNGEVRGPLKSAVREKIDQLAQWQIVENDKTAGKNKKNKKKKKLCWVVSEEALQKMELDQIELNNNWAYILQPKQNSNKTDQQQGQAVTTTGENESKETREGSVEQNSAINTNSNNSTASQPTTQNKTKSKADIKKFAKILTAEEKAEQLRKTTEQTKPVAPVKEDVASKVPKTTTTSSVNNSNSNQNSNPVVKKRVPLLMSVARGQAISTPDKNARISQFLKSVNEAKQKEKIDAESKDSNATTTTSTPTPMEVDNVVVLD